MFPASYGIGVLITDLAPILAQFTVLVPIMAGFWGAWKLLRIAKRLLSN